MRKSYLSIVLIAALALTACGTNASNATNVTSISVEDMPLSAEPTDDTTTQNNTIATNAFKFNDNVFSKKATTIYGEKTKASFYNLCAALRKGEDTFECPDEATYIQCIEGDLLKHFFPAAATSISADHTTGFADGVGKIKYNDISQEEFVSKEKAFEEKVVATLNANVDPSYSDFEKALSLYVYISQNFVYDYEMYEEFLTGTNDNTSACRALMENKGISQELSDLYSYLLLQCGVEADVVSGYNINGDHQWSYVSIGGKNYHVDPTQGLSSPDLFDDNTPLDYFLMTDNTRAERDGFPSSDYLLCGNPYTGNEASDDKYSSLTGGYFIKLDCNRNVLTYGGYDGGGVQEFRYDD
ncbi:MAG: hypothetical protein J5504_09135 [Butyrivibrio sp.]|nr:hypothetical protein [Butyrivibrio sp.]